MSRSWVRSPMSRACFVLLIALSLAGCGTSGVTNPAANGTSNSTLQAGSYGSVAETTTKVHKVTIVQVTNNAQSTNAAQEPATGKKYLTVKIFLEDKGTDPITPGQMKLRTTDGTDYDPVTVPGLTEPFSKPSLAHGAQATATFVFAIPQDAQPKWVKYIPNSSQDAAIQFVA